MSRAGWHAIVLDGGSAYLASGRERSQRPIKEGVTSHPVTVLERAAEYIRGNRAGVVLVDGGAARLAEWGQHTSTSDGRVRLNGPREWTATILAPWTTWRAEGAPAVHVGVYGAGGIELGRTPVINPNSAGETAARLAWYAEAMGGPWSMTGGVSGAGIIRDQWRSTQKRRAHQPYWGVKDRREADDPRTGIGDLIWRRAPLRAELDGGGTVHAFDLRAARLAAMGVAEVASDRLSHTGAQAFDPTLAGYWCIHAAEVREHPRHAPLIDQGDARNGLVWPTTPVMAELLDRGLNPDPVDSWTAPGRRLFRTVVERWNRARVDATLHGPSWRLDAVKATYRETAGMFAHPGGSMYRADWYHTIMDRQRVTLLRHVRRIAAARQVRPVAVHTDCLWYVSDQADPLVCAAELGITIGVGLGMFQHHSSTPAAQFFRRT